jgi:primosomal protein N' (replication factor Y)
MQTALELLQAARGLGDDPAVALYDPVPMLLEKLAGVHRAQLLIESPQRPALQRFLRAWLPRVAELPAGYRPRPRWQIEVDPLQI